MVSFQNSGISVKVAPFQTRSSDSQSRTVSAVSGGSDGGRREREICDLEVLQLAFKGKLLGDVLSLWICDHFLHSINFLGDVWKSNEIMSDKCDAFEYAWYLCDAFIFVILVHGKYLPLWLRDKQYLCTVVPEYASNTIIPTLITDKPKARHWEFLTCSDQGNKKNLLNNVPLVWSANLWRPLTWRVLYSVLVPKHSGHLYR